MTIGMNSNDMDCPCSYRGLDIAKQGLQVHGVEAICEAVGRPDMRFVAVKTEEQQSG